MADPMIHFSFKPILLYPISHFVFGARPTRMSYPCPHELSAQKLISIMSDVWKSIMGHQSGVCWVGGQHEVFNLPHPIPTANRYCSLIASRISFSISAKERTLSTQGFSSNTPFKLRCSIRLGILHDLSICKLLHGDPATSCTRDDLPRNQRIDNLVLTVRFASPSNSENQVLTTKLGSWTFLVCVTLSQHFIGAYQSQRFCRHEM